MAVAWDDAQLDEMRKIGDPLADNVISSLFESSGVYAVGELMKTLMQNDHIPPEQLPDQLKDYLEKTSLIPQLDPGAAERGQRFFQTFGPEILIILLCYSAPAEYAARKGVQVLYRTGYLHNRPTRRLFETFRLIMDVLTPGGLDSQGRGVRTAQKVRLMHAAIRWLILNNPEVPWDDGLGFPINQEDMALTLMTTTYLEMDGLKRFAIKVTPEEQQAYLEAWKVIARILGIQEQLIPEDMDAARLLYEAIQRRQAQPSPEGKAMTEALLEMLSRFQIPGAALMRHFLPKELADGFGIPKHPFEEWLLKSAAEFRKELDPILGHTDRQFLLVRKLGLTLVRGLVTIGLGEKQTPFVIPTNLDYEWHRAHRPSLWQQLSR